MSSGGGPAGGGGALDPPVHVVFVLDTSGSMLQRSGNGMSLLDCCRSAIEHFIRLRMNTAVARKDVYSLVTTCTGGSGGADGGCGCYGAASMACGGLVRAFDSTPPYTSILSALKLVEARCMSDIGSALKRSLDWLHFHRMLSGVDCFGQGRIPYMLEPAILLLFTDDIELSSPNAISTQLKLPMTEIPGGGLYTSPFRWDQSLFTLLLRMPSADGGGREATATASDIPPDTGSMATMCELMGGRCTAVTGLRPLLQVVEHIAQHSVVGAKVTFEPLHVDGVEPLRCKTKRAAIARRSLKCRLGGPFSGGNYLWPLPESPRRTAADGKLDLESLPAREANPKLYYVPVQASTSMMSLPQGMVVDNYDVDCPTLANLMIKAGANCWSLRGQSMDGKSYEAIGLLRLKCVNSLVVQILPWRYTALVPLIEKLVGMSPSMRQNPPRTWLLEMDEYISQLPSVYNGQMKVQMRKIGGPQCVAEKKRGILTKGAYHEIGVARQECASIIEKEKQMVSKSLAEAENAHMRKSKRSRPKQMQLPSRILEGPIFRSPSSVTRGELLEQISMLSVRLGAGHPDPRSAAAAMASRVRLQAEKNKKHSVSVAAMGDFMGKGIHRPLRDPRIDDELQNRFSFGNPFRKIQVDYVEGPSDEIDEAALEKGLLRSSAIPVESQGKGRKVRSRSRSPRPGDGPNAAAIESRHNQSTPSASSSAGNTIPCEIPLLPIDLKDLSPSLENSISIIGIVRSKADPNVQHRCILAQLASIRNPERRRSLMEVAKAQALAHENEKLVSLLGS